MARKSVVSVVAVVVVFVIGVVATSCGDDDDGGEASSITVSVSAEGIEAPEEISAGAVEVTLESELPPFAEVDFTRVEAGTSEDEFLEGLGVLLEGGPLPEFMLGNAGFYSEPSPATVLLEPGSYFVWADTSGEDSGELVVTQVEVTGDGDGELPDTDGTFTARDYEFDVDVSAGEVFSFTNEGPEQFHHAVLFGFGDLDPAVVEENLPEFFAAEEGELPEAFADAEIDFEAGSSGVAGPGSGATFAATLESGSTYAVVCFIQDRAGGPPHAIAYNMWDVFTVD